MKRNLLIPLIFSQAINAQAYVFNKELEKPIAAVDTKIAEYNQKLQALCGDDKKFDLEGVTASSNKIWKEIVNQINNARIPISLGKDVQLNDRTVVTIGGSSSSERSIGNRYSGIDKWKVRVGATLIGTKAADVGIDGTREVTFIQQFPSRCKSLVRVAYDPITKIPLNSERALNRLNPGDFVAFSSPLTLSLGKGLDRYFGKNDVLHSFVGASMYASGEFNIHVYRMDDKRVRVRFFAAKTKGVNLSFSVKYDVGGLFNVKPVSLDMGKALSDLFSADYIFNLNDPTVQEMYDKAMGEKFELTKVAFEGINPFEKDNSVKKRLFSDLGKIDEVSLEDLNVADLNKRRVIRLSKGDTTTKAFNMGIGFDLRLAHARIRATYAESLVDFNNVENENQKFLIKTISRQNDFNLFQIWGQEDTHNTALLVRTDDSHKPLYSTGLQTIRVKEELTFSKDEVRSLSDRLRKTLPAEIVQGIQLPDADKLKGPITNAKIEQSIFLDTQVLEVQQTITYDNVATELKRLIQTWGKLSSAPIDTDYATGSDNNDPRLQAKTDADTAMYYSNRSGQLERAQAKYLEAYSWEMGYIPTYLAGLFSKEPIEKKLEYYDKLQGIPLFNEIGIALVLNLIEQQDKSGNSQLKMKDVVSYRLSITGRGIEPKITEYPKVDDKGNAVQTSENARKSDIFRRILNDNAYMTDRSFNLRYYMNDKGDSLSLKEVVDRSK